MKALAQALGLTAPDQVLERLHTVYAELDRRLATATADLALPCHSGCHACCHEAVFVSAPEFYAVAVDLKQKCTRAELSQILAEMIDLAHRYGDEIEQLLYFAPGPERDEVAARIKFRCPLLGTDGGCSVYSVRELNARTFGQSFMESTSTPYGCELTQQRLKVIQDEEASFRPEGLPGAKAARIKLAEAFPEASLVQVYPYWFSRYAEFF